MTHEDFVTYEQAKILKDLGFDWECTHYYWENSESLREYLAKNIDMYHNSWDFNYTEYIDEYTIPSGKHFRENRFEDAYSAPTLAQAQKWLREDKDICVMPIKCTKIGNSIDGKYYSEIRAMDGKMIRCSYQVRETYEEALSVGLDEALEIIKNK